MIAGIGASLRKPKNMDNGKHPWKFAVPNTRIEGLVMPRKQDP